MAVSERDMLDSAEYLLDILDKTKPPHEQVGEGLVRFSVHDAWMERARALVKKRLSQYMDNGIPRRFGPDNPNPIR
jgi:hypothetical protein